MVLLKSASWRCRKRGGEKKRTLNLCPRKSGKFAIHTGWREFSAFFSPSWPSRFLVTETAFIFLLCCRFFPCFNEISRRRVFNEASKIIGSLTVRFYINFTSIFCNIYIYLWFYDPNFNVSILMSFIFFINWRKIFLRYVSSADICW